jgi:hypothetical protein
MAQSKAADKSRNANSRQTCLFHHATNNLPDAA